MDRSLPVQGKFYFRFAGVIVLVSCLTLLIDTAWPDSPSKTPSPTKQIQLPTSAPSEQKPLMSALERSIGPLAGVVIGYFLSGFREGKKERKKKLHALRAIKIELESVWDAYMRGPGEVLEKRGEQQEEQRESLGRHSEVSELSFTIYNRNSEIIGTLNDTALAEKIIVAYQQLGGIFKALELNNKFWEEGAFIPNQNSTVEISRAIRLASLADTLTERHKEIRPEMVNLFKELNSYLKSHDC